MEGIDRPINALFMHLQKPLRITKGNNSPQIVKVLIAVILSIINFLNQTPLCIIKLAPSPYFSTISICSVDMNMYARLDEIPLMTLQDIKETPSMHKKSHGELQRKITCIIDP